MIAVQVIYILILVTSLVLHAMLLAFAWKSRTAPGVHLFAAMLVLNFVTVLSFLLLQLSPTVEDTLIWARLRFVGLAFPPVFMLLFALDFTGAGQRFDRIWRFPVFVIPITTAVVSWCSPVPGLMFQSWAVERNGLLQLDRAVYGQWWVVHAAYSYLMVFCAIAVFARRTPRLSAPFRKRVAALVAVVVLIVLIALLSTFRLLPHDLPSTLPIMATLMTLLVSWVAFRLKMLDLMPAAHFAVMQNLSDGVIVVDINSRIVEMNPAAQRILGQRTAHLIGHSADEVLRTHTQSNGEIANVLSTLSRIVQLAHDPSRSYEFRIAPLRTTADEISGHIITLRDVTERRKAEQEREQLINTLDSYAHMVAHDLKNPIGSLLVYAELLKWELDKVAGVSDKAYQQIAQIKKGAKRLTRIIDELLIFARLRSNEDVVTSQVDMSALIKDVLAHLDDSLTSAEASTTVAQDIPPAIGYGPWIEEVLMNYVTNAIKYGGTPLRIEVGAERLDGKVKFWVRDNGQGLTTAEQDKLFEQFSRLEKHQKMTGNGLGLSIAREIIERLGGQVGVRSKPGEGSLFYFTLPAVPIHNASMRRELRAESEKLKVKS